MQLPSDDVTTVRPFAVELDMLLLDGLLLLELTDTPDPVVVPDTPLGPAVTLLVIGPPPGGSPCTVLQREVSPVAAELDDELDADELDCEKAVVDMAAAPSARIAMKMDERDISLFSCG